MTDLPLLMSTLEEAGEGSRELDTAIAIALRVGASGYPEYPLGSLWPGYVQANMGRGGWSVGWSVPPLTTSVDAALALIGERLPGWHPHMHQRVFTAPPHWQVTLRCWRDEAHANAPTLPLALCLALCRALQSQGETHDA